MAYDFRTEGVRAQRLIASGSDVRNIGLLIYSSSAASNMQGGRNSSGDYNIGGRLDNAGTDVWLYVDGVPSNDPRMSTSWQRDQRDKERVVLFAGDVVVSGTLYAGTQVIQVDESVQGDMLVPNNLYVSGTSVFNNARRAAGDFIVRSTDRSHALFVDANTDRVGIGFGVAESNDALATTPSLDSTLHVAEPDGQLILTLENEKSGSTAGDVQIDFKLGGTTKWAIGVDDSNSDKFNLSSGGTLGANRYIAANSNGQAAVVINEDGADIDFRIEGSNIGTLFSTNAADDSISIYSDTDQDDLLNVFMFNGSSYTEAFTIGNEGSQNEVVINDDSGDIDFRVETNSQTHALHVDAADDSITLTANQGASDAIDINATESGGGIDIDAGSGGITMDTSSGGAITVNATAAQLQIKTTTSGEVDITAAGAVDINAGSGLTIDTTDTSIGIKIGTDTASVPITIGNSTSEVTIADNLTVTGDLHVDGDTIYNNVTTMTVQDPIFDIGGGVDGAAPSGDDNKDRGVSFQWHNGAAAKKGFFGYDDSQAVWTFIPDATVNSEIVSGNPGTVRVRRVDLYDDGAESIYGDGTDIHFDVGAGGDINVPSDVGVTFGHATGDKIEGNGSGLTITSQALTIDSAANIVLDADGANVTIKDGGTTTLDIVSNGTTDVTFDAPGDIIFDATGADFLFHRGGSLGMTINQFHNGGGDYDMLFKDMGNTEIFRIDSSANSLLVASANAIEFRDSDLSINSSVDGQLDIDADTEVEITTTTLDINATTVDISGDLDVVGTLTPGALSLTNLTLGATGEINFGTNAYQIERDGTQLKFKDGDIVVAKTLADLATVSGIGPFEAVSTETAGGWTGGPDDTLKIRTTGSFAVTGDNQYSSYYGSDNFFFVSGSIGTYDTNGRQVSTFASDLIVSGNVELGHVTIDGSSHYISKKSVLAVSGTCVRPMALVSGSLRFQTEAKDYIGEITPGYLTPGGASPESEIDLYIRNIQSSGMIRFQAGGESSSNVIADVRGDTQSLRMGSGKKIQFAGASRYIDSSATTSINYVNSNSGGNHTFTGNIIPASNNTYNLGSESLRFANIYTGDLNLKNERGDWTILEEEDFLCVINNKTGKKFKMVLEPLEENE